jgi:hypothetical protein
MHLDGDIGDESYSGVDEEVPSCDTSCSSSLISIADSESENSDYIDDDDENSDYIDDDDDDDTNSSESSSSSSEGKVSKVCMLIWSEFRYICRVLNLIFCFFDKGSEETSDYLFQVPTTSQRTQKADWCKLHV